MDTVLLEFRDICIDFPIDRGRLRAVDHVTLPLRKGEILGVVGESGSGKTTLASAALNIVSTPGKITNGQVIYDGKDVLKLPPDQSRQFNWQNISMIFQAAQNSLNPLLRIRDVFIETVRAHDPGMDKDQILDKAAKLLSHVRLDARRVLDSYPHQLSGGMKQRTIIALSLILDPNVLILDEPTTALDAITQAYIMDILCDIHEELGISMILNTHDVALVGKMCDRVAVMYAGQIVEMGAVRDTFGDPKHPYTKGLLQAMPLLTDDVTKRKAIPGSPPDLINPPEGCRFHPRCEKMLAGKCNVEKSELCEVSPDHFVRCHFCGEEGVI